MNTGFGQSSDEKRYLTDPIMGGAGPAGLQENEDWLLDWADCSETILGIAWLDNGQQNESSRSECGKCP